MFYLKFYIFCSIIQGRAQSLQSDIAVIIAKGAAILGDSALIAGFGSKGQFTKLSFGYDFKNDKPMYPHAQNLWNKAKKWF